MAEASLSENDRAFLSVLVRGAAKTFENAESLYFEARLLAEAGAIARALCLHQISLEECSKIEHMGAWGTSLLAGLQVRRLFRAGRCGAHCLSRKSYRTRPQFLDRLVQPISAVGLNRTVRHSAQRWQPRPGGCACLAWPGQCGRKRKAAPAGRSHASALIISTRLHCCSDLFAR